MSSSRHRLLTFIAMAALSGFSPAQSEMPLLTRGADIRALPREVAARNLPVLIRGVITFADYGTPNSFVLQDETEGIYISASGSQGVSPPPVYVGLDRTRVGMQVEIRGITGPGGLGPIVIPQTIRYSGTSPVPPAKNVTLSELRSGIYDCQQVALEGVVQKVHLTLDSPQVWSLEILTADGVFQSYVADPVGFGLKELVDSWVKVRGTNLNYFNSRGEVIGVNLQISDPVGIEIQKKAPTDPFNVPPVSRLALRPFSQLPPSLHRQLLTGIVTLSRKSEFYYVQAGDLAVRVNSATRETPIPGDVVEVSGFVDLTRYFGEMREAIFRKIGTSPLPEPVETTPAGILGFNAQPDPLKLNQPNGDGRRIAILGKLVKFDIGSGNEHRLFLDCEGRVVIATMDQSAIPPGFTWWEVGSEVRATGICVLELSSSWPALSFPKPRDFSLLLESPASIEVLNLPPWWTQQRLATLLGIVTLGAGGAFAWVGLLRRNVAIQSRKLANEISARHDAELEYETTLRERTRLAADLHDTLEQSLTGVAFKLATAKTYYRKDSEQGDQQLAETALLLAHSREDVRRAIWNLRVQGLENRSFADALHATALKAAEGRQIEIQLNHEGPLERLPEHIAGNLLLLAQEAVTNAIKHADANLIRLEVSLADSLLDLSIIDNGKGFDPSMAKGLTEGHFGLQGMRERVKWMRGTLNIITSPGNGTRINANVPIPAEGSI